MGSRSGGSGAVIIQVLGDAAQAIASLDQVAAKVGELEGAGNDGAGGIENLADQMDGFLAQIPIAVGILTAAGAAFKEFFDTSEEGAQMERLGDTSTQLAETYGANMDEIVRKVRGASLGTISNLDIMASANKAMMLGVSASADELAELTQIAMYRGRALGLNSQQAFEQISIGIGRLSPKILDNLGIVVDASTNYENYAATIGKTADELTEYEKREALKNAVLEEGNRILQAAGGLAADNASQFEKLDAQAENLGNNFKEWLAPAGGRVITSLNGILFGINEVRDALANHQQDMQDTTGTYEDYRAEAVRSATAAGLFTKHAAQQAGAFRDGKIEVDKFLVSLGFLSEAEFTGMQITKEAVTINGDYVDMAEQVRGSKEDLTTATDNLAAAEEIENEKTDRLKTLMGELTEKLIFNQAAAGLNADQALELARAMGLINPETEAGIKAMDELTAKYDKNKDGAITGAEATRGYMTDVGLLGDAIAELQDRNITITTTHINQYIEQHIAQQEAANNYHWGDGGARASGGPVWPGMDYIYQERGPEGFRSNQSGTIIPAHTVNNFNLNMSAVAQRMIRQAVALERL